MTDKVAKRMLLGVKLDTLDKLLGFTKDLSELLGCDQSEIEIAGLMIRDEEPLVERPEIDKAIETYVGPEQQPTAKSDLSVYFRHCKVDDKEVMTLLDAYKFIRSYLAAE
jgi:hypothetical protein